MITRAEYERQRRELEHFHDAIDRAALLSSEARERDATLKERAPFALHVVQHRRRLWSQLATPAANNLLLLDRKVISQAFAHGGEIDWKRVDLALFALWAELVGVSDD